AQRDRPPYHTATAFLLAGTKKVIITARKSGGEQGIDQAVRKLNQIPGVAGPAVGIQANAANTEEIAKLVDEVRKSDGKLDILVANAGATWRGPFEPTPDWSSQKILDLNVHPIPLLEAAGTSQDPSRVIIVSSVAGVNVPHVGENGTIMYLVSKAVANHLVRNFAVELGNITTNAVAPGFFPSKLANGLIENLGGRDKLSSEVPHGRVGEPEDIAGVMIYLCSPAANYINGVDIAVDGGRRLGIGSSEAVVETCVHHPAHILANA
ncbi:hypothetical protein ACJ73_10036, partial [Blastomyces percursus]